VAGVVVLWSASMPVPRALIESAVIGEAVVAVTRRAKVLILELGNDFSMLFHLKMTGQMVLVRADGNRLAGGHPSQSMGNSLPDRSTRVVFEFEGGDRLFFNDQRKFGWVKLVRTTEVGQDSLVSRLGPEVLAPEFTADYLAVVCDRHGRAPIKAVILDQSTVGGIGNIYADESLHLAKIHPGRRAGSLTTLEIRALWSAVRTIIALGIQHGGTSFAHYVDALGGSGDYLDQARVFRRQGLPCPVCQTIIIKLRVAGRGTHICPHCQVLA
jgi:formamidopyrimidine-DNA glycosylase